MNNLVKICGITTPELAFETAMLGANYIGIVCFEGSKRYVKPELARDISLAAISGGAIPVLVCVDHTYLKLMKLVEQTDVTTVQLHGDVSRNAVAQLPEALTKIYVVSINAQGEPVITESSSRHSRSHCPRSIDNLIASYIPDCLNQSKDCLLFDGHNPGSGQPINTKNLDNMAQGYPYFLAGGLTTQRIESNTMDCHPTGFDVSSGIEDEYGVKRIEKIKAFIQAVKSRELSSKC